MRPAIPIVVVAVVVVVALGLAGGSAIGAASSTDSPARHAPAPALSSAAASVEAELAQIPQRGPTIGVARAPVTVFEYADLICNTCAQAAASVVAPVIASFVRSGAVRIEFDPIVESPRSEQYALGAYSAGVQHKAWDYIMLVYLLTTTRSDGPLYQPAALARSLDVNRRRWRALLRGRKWPAMIEQAAKVALLGGFSSYPVFIIRGPGIHRSRKTGGRSVIILRAPVNQTSLTQAIIAAEPASG